MNRIYSSCLKLLMLLYSANVRSSGLPDIFCTVRVSSFCFWKMLLNSLWPCVFTELSASKMEYIFDRKSDELYDRHARTFRLWSYPRRFFLIAVRVAFMVFWVSLTCRNTDPASPSSNLIIQILDSSQINNIKTVCVRWIRRRCSSNSLRNISCPEFWTEWQAWIYWGCTIVVPSIDRWVSKCLEWCIRLPPVWSKHHFRLSSNWRVLSSRWWWWKLGNLVWQ